MPECAQRRILLTWPSSSLAAGASVTYQATVKAAQPGTAVLAGSATSTSTDPNSLNNTATATIAVKQH